MQTFEENNSERRYRDYSLRLHMQRLSQIKSRGSHRIDNSCPKTSEMILPQKQGQAYLKKAKKQDICKENGKFSEILGEISAGKRESVTQKILNSAKDGKNFKKSLNLSVRKKKAVRITEENEVFLKRIKQVPGDLSLEKLNKDWEMIGKYKNIIQRKTPRYSSSSFVQTVYLPPLISQVNQDKNDLSFEKKRKNLTGSGFNKKREKISGEKEIEGIFSVSAEIQERKDENVAFFISEVQESQENGKVCEEIERVSNEIVGGIEESSGIIGKNEDFDEGKKGISDEIKLRNGET